MSDEVYIVSYRASSGHPDIIIGAYDAENVVRAIKDACGNTGEGIIVTWMEVNKHHE